MKYGGKEYNVVLTFRCKNCGAVDFINPEVLGKDGHRSVIIGDDFMDMAVKGANTIPIDVTHFTHVCSLSGGCVVIGPMEFEIAQVTEIKPEVKKLNEGETDGTEETE